MAIKRTLRPGEDVIRNNVYSNIRLGVEQLNFHLPQDTQIVLCCGGPTLKDHIEDIRRHQIEGAEVVCVGNAGHLLAANNIMPNGHIIMDGVDRNRTFVVDSPNTRYFIASQCDPSVFKPLNHHNHVYIWHAAGPPGVKEILTEYYGAGGYFMIPGGSYVSLRAITLLHVLGYTWMHVYGLDSCMIEDEHHSYSQPNADGQVAKKLEVAGKEFTCTYWMMDQASQFIDTIKTGGFGQAQLAIHGEGLIAHLINTGSSPTWRIE